MVGPFADAILRWLGRFRHRPAAGFLERLAIAYRAYRNHGDLLLRVGLISLAEQLFPVIIAGTVALSLAIPVTLPMLLVAVPLASFAGRLPISVGGIGVADGAMVYLLGLEMVEDMRVTVDEFQQLVEAANWVVGAEG